MSVISKLKKYKLSLQFIEHIILQQKIVKYLL